MLMAHAGRQRTLERYRLLFKITIAVCVLSIVMTLSGLAHALVASETTLLSAGMLLFVLAVLYGYRVVLSTMRILEEEADEHGWSRYC
jgi:hypothetical protein